ncbi:MAG: type II toxin-antitoxin system prevent-host-death family antitoxin [Rubrobacter sp.]
MKLPSVLGVSEARQELSTVLDRVEKGETFIIKGAGRGGALLMNAELFRRFQDSYLELIGELETERILRDEGAMEALRAATSDEPRGKRYALDEVEDMVEDDAGG